jgi:peptide-methionine (S)-S-oxide reductase
MFRLLTALAAMMLCAGSSPRARSVLGPPVLRQATFAAGCFWGVEAAFRRTPGVVATMSGYTGGNTPDPTYRDVALGHSGYAEAVLVTYDPNRISYAELLDVFWSCHDPTADMSLAGEPGPHRSAIFFHNNEQEAIARESMREVNESKVLSRPIVTQVVPAQRFFPAEDFHQHFFEQHGVEGTCDAGGVRVQTRLPAWGVRHSEPRALASNVALPTVHIMYHCHELLGCFIIFVILCI